jgi:hypothetical protein
VCTLYCIINYYFYMQPYTSYRFKLRNIPLNTLDFFSFLNLFVSCSGLSSLLCLCALSYIFFGALLGSVSIFWWCRALLGTAFIECSLSLLVFVRILFQMVYNIYTTLQHEHKKTGTSELIEGKMIIVLSRRYCHTLILCDNWMTFDPFYNWTVLETKLWKWIWDHEANALLHYYKKMIKKLWKYFVFIWHCSLNFKSKVIQCEVGGILQVNFDFI